MHSLEIQGNPVKKDDYIFLKRGIALSRKSMIKSPSQINHFKMVIGCNSIIRADIARINLQDYVIICDKVILHPSHVIKTDSTSFTSMTIGAYTIIGNESIVKAFNIGSFVRVGKNCIIGDRSTIGDNCIIRDHSIVLPGTIIPNNTIWEGKPAKFVG